MGTELEKEVRLNAAKTEAAWKGIGQVPGILIWRIEKFHIVPVPKESYGTFYDGVTKLLSDRTLISFSTLSKWQMSQSSFMMFTFGSVLKQAKVRRYSLDAH